MPNISDEEFIATWTELGSPQAVADKLSLDVRGVYRRRNELARKGFDLPTTNKMGNTLIYSKEYLEQQLTKRLTATRHSVRRGTVMQKGRVLVFSDAHFYPDDETTAFRALIECIKEFQEKIPSNVIYYKFDINDDKNFSMFTNILRDNDLIYLLIEEYNQDLLEYIQENNLL